MYENCGAAVLVFDVNDYETAKKARTLGNNIKGKTGNFPTKFLVVGNKVLYDINFVSVCTVGFSNYDTHC